MPSETISYQFDLFYPDEELQKTYAVYNEKYFGMKLPTVQVGFYYGADEKQSYGSTIRLHGAAYPSYICLNPYFRGWVKTLEATLLHEMSHVKLRTLRAAGKKIEASSHGKQFQAEIRRLMRAGAFDDLL